MTTRVWRYTPITTTAKVWRHNPITMTTGNRSKHGLTSQIGGHDNDVWHTPLRDSHQMCGSCCITNTRPSDLPLLWNRTVTCVYFCHNNAFCISGYFKLPWPLNPLKPELNPICYLLALLGFHHFLHVSRIRVKSLTFRLLMSYIYGAPILDVSRTHTTRQHSR